MTVGNMARALALVLLGFAWRPAAGQDAAGQAGPAPPGPTGRTAPDRAAQPAAGREDGWNQEILAVTDLLIDGKYMEAKARATKLLADKQLTDALAARARQLLAKAEAKLASAAPGGAAPRLSIENAGSPVAQPAERIFPVQVAVIGLGFGEGAHGHLRISAAGLSFTAEGSSPEAWHVRWPDLVRAGRDEGIWDVPFPLVVVERSGKKHYLSYIDASGRYRAGDEILAAIAKARNYSKPSKATSGAGDPTPHDEEHLP